jgi:hypothetical protein
MGAGERVGALHMLCQTREEAEKVLAHLKVCGGFDCTHTQQLLGGAACFVTFPHKEREKRRAREGDLTWLCALSSSSLSGCMCVRCGQAVIRPMYSSPPCHYAKVATLVLTDQELFRKW